LRKGLQRSQDHSPEDLGRKIHGATTAAIGRAVRGRQWTKHPELKPKPKPEGRGMAFAIAHLDELIQKAEKKEQAQRRVGCLFIFGKHRDHHHLNYLWTSFVSFSSVSVLGSFSLIVFLQQKG